MGLLSFAWIVYVVITIGNNSESPLPAVVFSEKDTSVAVVHKPAEIQFNNPEYAFIQKTPLYLQVLENAERVQHFYFSSSRGLALLERSKPWTFELVSKYFDQMGYGVTLQSGKELKVSNGWKGRYHDNYLVVYDGEWSETEQPIVQWSYIDRKSSTSLVKKENGKYIIENSYSLGENRIKYVSQQWGEALPLVDDQEFFQEMIPANFDEYTFYEKEYLKTIGKSSPVFEFMNHGMVVIEDDDNKCAVIDFISGQEPMAVLQQFLVDDDGNTEKGELKNVKLPIPLFKGNLHIEVINGYALISDSRQFIDKMIGAHETGNTLDQSSLKRFNLFKNTPKQVSYRHISSSEHITKSVLNKSIHTVAEVLNDKQETETEKLEQLPPIRLDGDITNIIPIEGTSMLYVTTTANTLHFINNNALAWTVSFTYPLVGSPVIVPGTQALAFATDRELHFITSGGAEQSGFPMSCSSVQSPITTFVANGQAQFGVVANGAISTYAQNGSKTSSVSFPESGSSILAITTDKRGWIANVVTSSNWYTYNLKRKTKLKSYHLGEGDWYLAHYNNNILPVGIQKNKFIRFADNGKSTVLVGGATKMIRYKASQNQELFFLTQKQHIYVVDGMGTLITQFNCSLSTIQDAYLIRSKQGKTFVGLLDGISNNSYIYTINGNEANKQVFEGSEKIVFQYTADGTLLLISASNGYLLRYPLNL